MATHKPFTEISTLPANANGDVTILEAHLDSAHNTIVDVLEYLAQAIWSAGGVVIPGTVSNPSDALVRVQNRLGVTADARTLLAVADQSVDLADVATGNRCLVVVQAKAGASTSHNFVDSVTGESITHSLLSAWGKVEVIEGDNSNYPPLPDDCVPVAEVTKTGAATLTIDSVITSAPTLRAQSAGVDWGDVGGILANQTDLQNALNARLEAGDELTDLASTGVTSGYVPKADGTGGIDWAAESGGGGGGDISVVTHGSNASEARPAVPIVYWIGSVAPTNRQTGDLWLEV